MGHEWKIGDWAELYDGTRYLIVKAWYQGDCQFVNAYSGSGAVRTFSIGATNIKHLPECTGWGWEPTQAMCVNYGCAMCMNPLDGGTKCEKCGFELQVEQPTSRKWEFGDSVHSPEGIVRFFFEKDGGGLCVSKDGRSHCFQFKYLEYLPDCTGFDWNDPVWNPINPIEPPLGYRIIADGVVSDGDMSLQDRGWYYSTAKGRDIAELLDLGAAKAYARKIEPKPIEPPPGYRLMKDEETIRHGDMFWQGGAWNQTGISVSEIPVSVALAKYARYRITAYARKIEPVYRPFANAAEFAPHRDKWLVDKDGDQFRIETISDNGNKIGTPYGGISFGDAFNRYKFEDGTPFGVLDIKE